MPNGRRFVLVLVWCTSLLCIELDRVLAQQPDARQTEFFESKVRPLLADRCWKCHGDDKANGKLRLDSLQHIIDGGESGPALTPGDVAGSLLLQAVRYESLEMPPASKLSADEIRILERWVDTGAKWPNQTAVAATKRDSEEVTDQDRNWWAFRPIVRPDVSQTDGSNPIDVLIEKSLRGKGLRPSPPAGRQQLIRRVYFDLIGLPPSFGDVQSFCQSDDPRAFAAIIDDLLGRFEYGERWGRHWLDVVRFAQTNGYERDDEKPLAWRYRDYVIKSFNDDKPYDQFVREQLAGDEMEPVTDDSLDATGFYRLGVWDDEPDDARQAEFDGLDDMLSTTGTAFLGLSIGCARCHSHKFDPLPHEDYYRMLAFFRNINGYQKPSEENASIFQNLPSGAGRTLAVTERGPTAPETHVLIRGDSGSPGDEVSAGFPRVFFATAADSNAVSFDAGASDVSTGRRTELARWITSVDNPLTARVIVNRLWHHHFGKGLVETPSDFGRTGSPPSHPELLDFLASELVANQWRLKPIHRLILTSQAWQQSSAGNNPLARQIDPGNRLLWRQNVRRLEAETIRDSLLSVAGTLNPQRGGRGFFPQMPPEVLAGQSRPGHGWDDSDADERCRRSVYVFAKRGITDSLLEVFDVATTDQSVPARTSTTVAPQALTLLNSRFVEEQATFAANHLSTAVPSGDPVELTAALWRRALSREPSKDELETITAYFRQQRRSYETQPVTIQLRQMVPTALHTPVLNRRQPSEMLDGPDNPWQYSKGQWNDTGDEIFMAQMAQTPAAVYGGRTFGQGTVRGRMRVDGQPDALSIAVGASIEQELLNATEFVFSGVNGEVTLRKTRAEKSDAEPIDIASSPFVVLPHTWIRFEITIDDDRALLRLNDALAIDHPAADLSLDGHLAFRTWGAGLTIQDLRIETTDGTHVVSDGTAMDRRQAARRKALAALCNLVFNLNEFVYVD